MRRKGTQEVICSKCHLMRPFYCMFLHFLPVHKQLGWSKKKDCRMKGNIATGRLPVEVNLYGCLLNGFTKCKQWIRSTASMVMIVRLWFWSFFAVFPSIILFVYHEDFIREVDMLLWVISHQDQEGIHNPCVVMHIRGCGLFPTINRMILSLIITL